MKIIDERERGGGEEQFEKIMAAAVLLAKNANL